MSKQIIIIGSCAALFAVLIGAFGAHTLNDLIASNDRLDAFSTASKYHFYHSFALLFLGLIAIHVEKNYLLLAKWGFTIGIIIFSGSLYILAITNISWLGAITPIGGVCFIFAWVGVAMGVFRGKQ